VILGFAAKVGRKWELVSANRLPRIVCDKDSGMSNSPRKDNQLKV
jgi:hypothetical protein